MSYCLIRFPQYAGKASGLVGGGFAVVTSVLSSLLANTLTITNQAVLGVAYGVLSLGVLAMLLSAKWQGSAPPQGTQTTKQPASEEVRAAPLVAGA